METIEPNENRLSVLAQHLFVRREAILADWRIRVAGDKDISTASTLPRAQLNDHIPHLLADYECKLRRTKRSATELEASENAVQHGLHRWQQGYDLREVMREWGHLQTCVLNELEIYASTHRSLPAKDLTTAWRILSQLFNEGVSESASKYYEMQETEAVGHVRDLENAAEELTELERRRGELWRQAAHDLRGNVGAVVNVTEGLTMQGLPDLVRDEFVALLQKSVSSLHSMLDEVIEIGRLQAGQEHRQVARIDVSPILRDLGESLQPISRERGLVLSANGPASLEIECDAGKIRRIAQNLIINALKYTQQGSVTLSWGDSRTDDVDRWMLCVTDTGPGFHAGPGAPLAEALVEATSEAMKLDAQSEVEGASTSAARSQSQRDQPMDDRPVHQEQGEGIGLSIVKRLCDLLDASVELESGPGQGTIFRVIFPRDYQK
ncbi:ATP-binding protein [Lacipirellula sp.]|uniref:ATP-binding protein n=1 Tax=Lacipirellula sp. TaxID=2691419 RepID=UPI003D0EE08F